MIYVPKLTKFIDLFAQKICTNELIARLWKVLLTAVLKFKCTQKISIGLQ